MQAIEHAPHRVAAGDANDGENGPDGWDYSQRNMDAKQREDENLRHQRHAVANGDAVMQDSKNDCQRDGVAKNSMRGGVVLAVRG